MPELWEQLTRPHDSLVPVSKHDPTWASGTQKYQEVGWSGWGGGWLTGPFDGFPERPLR